MLLMSFSSGELFRSIPSSWQKSVGEETKETVEGVEEECYVFPLRIKNISSKLKLHLYLRLIISYKDKNQIITVQRLTSQIIVP